MNPKVLTVKSAWGDYLSTPALCLVFSGSGDDWTVNAVPPGVESKNDGSELFFLEQGLTEAEVTFIRADYERYLFCFNRDMETVWNPWPRLEEFRKKRGAKNNVSEQGHQD